MNAKLAVCCSISVFENEIMVISFIMWNLQNYTNGYKALRRTEGKITFNWQSKHIQQVEGVSSGAQRDKGWEMIRTNMCKPRQGGKSLKKPDSRAEKLAAFQRKTE